MEKKVRDVETRYSERLREEEERFNERMRHSEQDYYRETESLNYQITK